jgi:allantoinase
MTAYDLLVRGGTLVTADGPLAADLAISGEVIAAIGPELSGGATTEIDAGGLHVFPGVIDAHVHFNEPGRTEWEGFATGTRALAAGGSTCCFEMPLNAHPPTLDAASFDLKRAAAGAVALVDFALWGGLVPGNLDQMDELAELGVIGFKAFMAASGIEDFPMADDLTLYQGMARAAALGLLVAVHAENDQITAALARRALTSGAALTPHDYLRSRPVIAELEAIARAILFAEETGCRLHIVHVSTGRGVALVVAARQRGVNVTCETCPHYLVLSEDDIEPFWPWAKCAPPLRPRADQDELWERVFDDSVDLIASDHSPAPPAMKQDPNPFQVWGGIAGCQHLLPLLLDAGHQRRGLPLAHIAALTAGNVAERFGLVPRKGHLLVGADADLALVDLAASETIEREQLHYRHQHSPYFGRTLRGRVVRTMVRGHTVYLDGQIVSAPIGRFIAPVRVPSRHQSSSPAP